MAEERIPPRYDVRPGKSLEIFAGEAVVRMDGLDVVGEVDVWFDWHAGLRIKAHGDSLSDSVIFPEVLEVVLPHDRAVPVESSSFTTRRPRGSWEMNGRAGPILLGDGSAVLQTVLFHAGNLPKATFGMPSQPFRVLASCGTWDLSLDVLPDYNQRVMPLRLDKGGAVTHVGALTRSDGATFSWNDAQLALEAAATLMSFVSSRRVPTLFPVGLDVDGATVIEQWVDWKRDPFGGAIGWCSDLLRNNAIQELWTPIFSYWQTTDSRHLITVALELYLDAQRGRNLETRLVSAQAGLELMAWHWLTRREPRLDPSVVDKNNAAWRLRRLLERVRIPTDVPDDLATVQSTWPNRDGPQVISALRNQVTHPKSLDFLLGLSEEVKHGVLRLALWYLELTLLGYLGYTGNHLNQTRPLPIYEGRGEPVPWA